MNRITKSHKQFMLLLVARGATLGLGFVSSLIFVAFMSQETFGQYKYIVNIYGGITVFALLGIPYTSSRLLLRTDDAAEMQSIYSFTCRLLAKVALFTSALAVMGVLIVQIIRSGTIELFLIVMLPFFSTIMYQSAFVTMLQGSNRVLDISIQTLIPTLLLAISVFILGKTFKNLSISIVMLIFISVYLFSHIITIKRLRIDIFERTPDETRIAFVNEWRENGFHVYLGSLVGVASGYVTNLILGVVSGMSEYGLFGLSLSLAAPMQFIPSVMGTVLFRENYKSNSLGKLNLTITFLMSISALVFYVLFLRLLFPIYPENYINALPYTITLSFYSTLMGLGDYFNRFISAHGFGILITRGAMISGIINIISSFILIMNYFVIGAVWARTISGAVYLMYMIFAYTRVTKQLRGMG